MVFVNNRIPHGVKLISRVVVGEGEVVTTSVTLRVLRVNSRESVEWLVDISEIVDEQAECIRFAALLVALHGVHHCGIDEAALVVGSAGQPINNSRNSLRNILGIELEVGIVVDVVTLLEVGGVNEVPV